MATLRSRQSGGEDIWTEQHVVVGEAVRNRREVGSGVGYQEILRPGAVDRVAEPPAAEGPAALGMATIQTIEALPAGRDRAHNDTLTDRVLAVQTGTQRF